MRVQSLHLYPVKSCRGTDVTEATTDAFGFHRDRRWMIVDPSGKFITQRQFPQMARIQPHLSESGLQFHHDQLAPLDVPFPSMEAPRRDVVVWRSTVAAATAGEVADTWLTEAIGTPCHLVYMTDDCHRAVNPEFGGPEDRVSFADGYPMLLTTTASLSALNERLLEPVPMNRFRPNIVIDGLDAFAEESWNSLRIGTLEVAVTKPCIRCVITSVDQASGISQGAEPLRTLASWRGKDQVAFGINLIHRNQGTVRVGDLVTVIA